jgi:hypothetical protein
MVFCLFPRTQGKSFSHILWREPQARGINGQEAQREVGPLLHKLSLGSQGSRGPVSSFCDSGDTLKSGSLVVRMILSQCIRSH